MATLRSTQRDELLSYLQKYKSIDPLSSLEHLGIYRLSSLIHKLRSSGYVINTKIKEVESARTGRVHKIAVYTLLQGQVA